MHQNKSVQNNYRKELFYVCFFLQLCLSKLKSLYWFWSRQGIIFIFILETISFFLYLSPSLILNVPFRLYLTTPLTLEELCLHPPPIMLFKMLPRMTKVDETEGSLHAFEYRLTLKPPSTSMQKIKRSVLYWNIANWFWRDLN